jgi:sortase (surface protein transpeptidase)
MQPSELENLEYYEFHYLMKDLADYLKKKNEAESGQQEQSSDMMSKMKIPNMKIPNMKIPKL